MSRPPKEQAPVRQVSNRRPSANTGRAVPPQRRSAYTNVAPKRDPFPYVMGGLIGALVVGLMLAVFLLTSNNRGTAPQQGSTNTGNGQASGGQAAPTIAPATEAGRMSMDEFKALYDDPAKRPVILDVRTKEIYDQGHITGSISFPEADVDTRVSELPKDKLIVAYCQ